MSSNPPNAPPSTLADGRYLLVKPLGEGGMASVFKAFDQRLQVWRAVKILNPELALRPRLRQRFEAEAQTMALLEHRHIVRVYDVGTDGDHAYIVMEIVTGGCLVDWTEDHGPMPPRMAIDVMLQVCEGITAAHAKGVIHRDIKPHNILITADQVCRVTDFGIARVSDASNNMTKTGAVMGTWGYMAPEQRMDAKHVDVRADVYALAATLYSLLTNKTPMDLFAADRDDTMLEGIPEALKVILVKGTEYRREDRYDDVNAFGAALRVVRDQLPPVPAGTPPLATDPGPPSPPPNPKDFAKVRAPSGGGAGYDTSVPPGDDNATMLPDYDDPVDSRNATIAPDGSAGRTLAPEPGHRTLPPSEGPPVRGGVQQTVPTWRPGDTGAHGALTPAHGAPAPRSGVGIFAWIAVAAGLAAVTIGLLAVAGAIVATGPFGGSAKPPAMADARPVEPPARDPIPEAPPGDDVTQADPVDSPPIEPTPIEPKPASVIARPPEPARVVRAPEPVQPTRAPEPIRVQVTRPPDDPPPASAQCVKVTPPNRPGVGVDALFKVKLCEADGSNVQLFYRPTGGRWSSKSSSTVVFGAYNIKVPLDASYAAGMEYYVTAGDTSFGSAAEPHRVQVN